MHVAQQNGEAQQNCYKNLLNFIGNHKRDSAQPFSYTLPIYRHWYTFSLSVLTAIFQGLASFIGAKDDGDTPIHSLLSDISDSVSPAYFLHITASYAQFPKVCRIRIIWHWWSEIH